MTAHDTTHMEVSFAEQYLRNEAMWEDVIDTHYPGGQLVNISPHHRVVRHEGKAIKIQNRGGGSTIVSDQTVEAEYEILRALDGAAGPLQPRLRALRTDWQALELDWIEGRLLADILMGPPVPQLSARTLAARAFAVARRGIIHSQFRGRHIIVDECGEMAFIDFGGSRKSSPVRALLHAFFPVTRSGSRWRVATFWYLVKKILDHQRKGSSIEEPARPSMAHWSFVEQAAELAFDLDRASGRHLRSAETEIKHAVAADPSIALEIPTVFIGPFYIRGSEHWEILWHDISRALPLQGRRVIVPNAGIGLAAIFASIGGASYVRASETNLLLLSAAEHLCEAFEGPAPAFTATPDLEMLSHDDVVIQLSRRRTREDQVRDLQTFSTARDIVFRTNLTDDEIEEAIETDWSRTVLRGGTGWRLIHFSAQRKHRIEQST